MLNEKQYSDPPQRQHWFCLPPCAVLCVEIRGEGKNNKHCTISQKHFHFLRHFLCYLKFSAYSRTRKGGCRSCERLFIGAELELFVYWATICFLYLDGMRRFCGVSCDFIDWDFIGIFADLLLHDTIIIKGKMCLFTIILFTVL